jgi:chromosome segregation ATPase
VAPISIPKQQTVYPPITQSYSELMALHVKDLRKILEDRHISHKDCLEKSELVNRIIERKHFIFSFERLLQSDILWTIKHENLMQSRLPIASHKRKKQEELPPPYTPSEDDIQSVTQQFIQILHSGDKILASNELYLLKMEHEDLQQVLSKKEEEITQLKEALRECLGFEEALHQSNRIRRQLLQQKQTLETQYHSLLHRVSQQELELDSLKHRQEGMEQEQILLKQEARYYVKQYKEKQEWALLYEFLATERQVELSIQKPEHPQHFLPLWR